MQVADRWHLYHNLSERVAKAAARHRACLQEPAPEPEAARPLLTAAGRSSSGGRQAG